MSNGSAGARRYNGGVRNLADLKGRCVVDEVSGCWHLRDRRGRVIKPGPSKIPAVYLHSTQSTVSARRAAWLLARPEGTTVPAGRVIASVCGCWDCVAPHHLRALTMAELGARMVKDGRAATPAKRAAAQRSARRRPSTKLTPELAHWARESTQVQTEVAHALGVCQTRISDIRAGRHWRMPEPLVPGASVFSWDGGA